MCNRCETSYPILSPWSSPISIFATRNKCGTCYTLCIRNRNFNSEGMSWKGHLHHMWFLPWWAALHCSWMDFLCTKSLHQWAGTTSQLERVLPLGQLVCHCRQSVFPEHWLYPAYIRMLISMCNYCRCMQWCSHQIVISPATFVIKHTVDWCSSTLH